VKSVPKNYLRIGLSYTVFCKYSKSKVNKNC